MLAPSLIAGLFYLSQLRREATAFRLGLGPLVLELRLTFSELAGRGLQRDVVPLLRVLERGSADRDRLLERLARRALVVEPPLRSASRSVSRATSASGRLMLAPSLIAGFFYLSQLRGEATAFRLGLGPLVLELRLTFSELAGRGLQRDVVPLLRVLERGSADRDRLLERVARRALVVEPPLEVRLALRQPRDVGNRRLMLAPSLIAGLLYLSQLRGEATAFRLGLSPLVLELRLTFGELAGRGLQRDVVPLLRVLERGSADRDRLLERVARRALVVEPPLEVRLALNQPRHVGNRRLMLAPSLIAGLLYLSQLRGEATAFRLGLGPLVLELRLTFGELAGRCLQRDVVPLLLILERGSGDRDRLLERVARRALVVEPPLEVRLALRQPRDVGDRRLMLAPSLIAGLFYLSQLRGEATAFRLGLSPLVLELRLTFGELAGRRLQRDVVPLLRILERGSADRDRLLERVARRALVVEPPLEVRLALRQPCDVGDGRLMLAPSLIAGFLYLSQLRGEATAFRLGLSPLVLELRLTFGELAGRRL